MKKLFLLLFLTIALTACTTSQPSKTDINFDLDGNRADKKDITNKEKTMDKSTKLVTSTGEGLKKFSDDYDHVLMKTSMGDIKIKLYGDESPLTVNNFLNLIKEGYYDGIKFHRVINGFMIQGGDPLTKDDSKQAMWGTGGPGYSIQDEYVSGLTNKKGTLSMANSGPNTGGSQFFINLIDNTFLDWDKEPLTSKHPVFGEVVEGFDVVEKIGEVATAAGDRPIEPVVITDIELIEKE